MFGGVQLLTRESLETIQNLTMPNRGSHSGLPRSPSPLSPRPNHHHDSPPSPGSRHRRRGSAESVDITGPTTSGSFICIPHGLVFCCYCSVDCSFTEEILEDSDDTAERETHEVYERLSDISKARIDARCGPPPRSGTRTSKQFSTRLLSSRPIHGYAKSSESESESGLSHSCADPNSSAPTNMFFSGFVWTPVREQMPSPTPTRAARNAFLPINIIPGLAGIFPAVFTPPLPTSTPAELFLGSSWRRISMGTDSPASRFIRRNDQGQALIYTDGACLNNGQANPKAGWAFVFGPGTSTEPDLGTQSGRLERKGPLGSEHSQTSNRAELRAVIAALRYRNWQAEGRTSLVIATDSEYVVKGATVWARRWAVNGWKNSKGASLYNQDLWATLLGEVERWASWGMEIKLWRIPRELNGMADQAAKLAARMESRE